MEVTPIEIRNYITKQGKRPFPEWRDSLRDTKAKARIRIRLDRVRQGNLGDYRSVGEGVFEFKIDYGPGYRIELSQQLCFCSAVAIKAAKTETFVKRSNTG